MPKFHVDKTILIDAPISKVYEIISNLNKWNVWSPWLVLEPEAKFTVAEDGNSYAWEGERVGSGEMRILGQEENRSVNFDLQFLKPWKSQADIRFELGEVEGQTEVTWLMDSKLPFYLFFMKPMMIAFLGMDFDRGLNMLKDFSEDDQVHSNLEFIGETQYAGCTYFGITRHIQIADLGQAMQADFETLRAYVNSHQVKVTNEPISIYHKWEMVKGMAKYTAAIPVLQVPDNLASDMVSGAIPETQVYKLRHTGPYKHLGNPWSAMMNLERTKVFKHKKGIHPFESYANSPANTPEQQLVTDVNFAIK